ncbi:hypothetical protein ATI61_11581 [Archangium gephyra]|uniref:Lipoprotein n=1 Tax=Archangium gephyra TaxID=48 RepID=A0AAC8TGD9_9BACT|nr:hypothetical protein [Archangium gephyra]AKJ03451.1 Hypothetical protein AA314_05077 [Archangium gephyra]REG24042.1 hypothetical protein ATI61_11581 [Archangium gephyra]
MKKMIGALASLTLAACGPQIETVSFKDGMPSQEMAKLDVPEKTSQRIDDGVATVRQQGRGDLSGTWLVTGGTVLFVNGVTLWTLGSLNFVAGFEPASDNGTTAVWGPHTNDWERTTWKLTAVRTAPNAFTYTLEAKPKGSADSEYAAIITGSHTVAVDEDGKAIKGYGEGRFDIDYDKAARLPSQDSKRGRVSFHYARPNPTAAVTVDVDLKEFVNDATVPNTAAYRYSQVPGGEGAFEFATDSNIHWFDPTKVALERWTIKSRWLATGAGRADVRATGGDLASPVTLNECWDTNFRSTFLDGSASWQERWGVESSDCAFTGASYSTR